MANAKNYLAQHLGQRILPHVEYLCRIRLVLDLHEQPDAGPPDDQVLKVLLGLLLEELCLRELGLLLECLAVLDQGGDHVSADPALLLHRLNVILGQLLRAAKWFSLQHCQQ